MGITFNHSGGIGDILFSLYFCRDLITSIKQEKFDFNIQTNVHDPNMKAHSHPFGDVRMSNAGAEFLKPLLEVQPYINKVTINDNIPNAQPLINLDKFRELKINFAAGDIRNWYYNLSKQHLPREFWKPVLFVEKLDTFKNKIIFSHTERYQNISIDYNVLKDFANNMIFFGTEQEHEIFARQYFNIEYYKCSNALEAAKLMMGAKGFISGQGGLYSIAECLKIPRILVGPEIFIYNGRPFPGPHNNHPQGGWCEDVATSEKMKASIEELLKCK